jgi:hypothetical protein
MFAPGEGVATISTTGPTVTYMSGTSFGESICRRRRGAVSRRAPDGNAGCGKDSNRRKRDCRLGHRPGCKFAEPTSLFSVPGQRSVRMRRHELYRLAAGCGASAFQSGVDGFSTGTGDFDGALSVPQGATFSLVLEKKEGPDGRLS